MTRKDSTHVTHLISSHYFNHVLFHVLWLLLQRTQGDGKVPPRVQPRAMVDFRNVGKQSASQ